MAKKNIIYSSLISIDEESKKEFIEEHKDTHPNIDSWVEEKLYEEMAFVNSLWLSDEKMNLDIPTKNPIICIADLGLWNGRKQGYRILGKNVNEIFTVFSGSIEDAEFYSDGYNICCDAYHHDGVNHYIFKELRPEYAHDAYKLIKATNKPWVSRFWQRRAKSILPYVAKTYGWKINFRKEVK